jgi:PhzF family phenazine biosynthesis protein
MKIPLFQVDAFAEHIFEGNPAAVCPLNEWLDDALMQTIAEENNLSETAFFVATKKGFHIRWFTPVAEVDLCGHATLASAYVVFNYLNYSLDEICFESKSGDLFVKKSGDLIEMSFPAQMPIVCEFPPEIDQLFNIKPIACLKAEDYLFVFESEQSIIDIEPNFEAMKMLDLRGVLITAVSEQYDFVTRFFAPKLGVNEDPVTGSAYTKLAPYWADKLAKNKFKAKQLSNRSGVVYCENKGKRVLVSGSAVMYMQGEIQISKQYIV